MSIVDKALATQLKNIETRTGKTLAELSSILNECGLEKHGQRVNFLKTELGMGHGDANTMVHYAKCQATEQSSGTTNTNHQITTKQAKPDTNPLDTIYADKKAHLRPVHDFLLEKMTAMGSFEHAPKKSYVSYRGKKQFCMIGPATNTQIEIGLNVKELAHNDRLKTLPKGQMCKYKTRISSLDEIDESLLGWIQKAYSEAT